jgi:putative toxin-antitoxin system antitoxin component (TIGR02293 family)
MSKRDSMTGAAARLAPPPDFLVSLPWYEDAGIVNPFTDAERVQDETMPYKAYCRLIDAMHLDHATFQNAFGLAATTMNRRKQSGKLTAEEADMVYRLVEAMRATAEMLGGDVKAAKIWLETTNPYFSDKPPIGVIKSTFGFMKLLRHINRVRHGVMN